MAMVAEMEQEAAQPEPLASGTATVAVVDLKTINEVVAQAIAAHLPPQRARWQTAVIGILATGLIALAGVAYSTVRSDMTAMRTEISTEIGDLRTEISTEIGGLRSETSAEISGLRAETSAEIGGLRSEISAKIGGLRSEISAEIGGLRAEIGDLRVEMREEFARVHMVLLDHTDRLARLEATVGVPRADDG